MPFSVMVFGRKLERILDGFGLSLPEVSARTGITEDRISKLIAGGTSPTADEVLIFSDMLKRDVRYLIEDDFVDEDEQIDIMFRKFSQEISGQDRLKIAEFMYLCKQEALYEGYLQRNRIFVDMKFASFEIRVGSGCRAGA
jgi:transcriptional regulator with XRE-family HTH domain